MKTIRALLLPVILCLCLPLSAGRLSSKATISLITCSPGEELYALFGHSAIRVKDPIHQFDVAFNYGVFSFNTPNFYWKFMRGETDYMLAVYDFKNFLQSYIYDQRSVYENSLNLTLDQKEALFDSLLMNAREEHKFYRYDFIRDNCASRVRDIIEQRLDHKIIWNTKEQNQRTFRSYLDEYLKISPWADFGIDLALGTPVDKNARSYQTMFLPDYLMKNFEEAQIKNTQGTHSLLGPQKTLYQAPESPNSFHITPLMAMTGLFLFLSLISYLGWKNKRHLWIIDGILFSAIGLTGVILFFLAFCTVHTSTHPNFNLLWAWPIHLFFGIGLFFRKIREKSPYYFIFTALGMVTFLFAWPWLPQSFNPAIFPLIFILLIRSWPHLLALKRRTLES